MGSPIWKWTPRSPARAVLEVKATVVAMIPSRSVFFILPYSTAGSGGTSKLAKGRNPRADQRVALTGPDCE